MLIFFVVVLLIIKKNKKMKTSQLKLNYLSINFCNVILNNPKQFPDVFKFNTLFMNLQIEKYNISFAVNSNAFFKTNDAMVPE